MSPATRLKVRASQVSVHSFFQAHSLRGTFRTGLTTAIFYNNILSFVVQQIEPFQVAFTAGQLAVGFGLNCEPFFGPGFKIPQNLAPDGIIFDYTSVQIFIVGLKLRFTHRDNLGAY